MTFDKDTLLPIAGVVAIGAVFVWYMRHHSSVIDNADVIDVGNQPFDPSRIFADNSNPNAVGTPSFDPGDWLSSLTDTTIPTQDYDSRIAKILGAFPPPANVFNQNDPRNSCGCGTGNNFLSQLTSATPDPYVAPDARNYIVDNGYVAPEQTVWPPIQGPSQTDAQFIAATQWNGSYYSNLLPSSRFKNAVLRAYDNARYGAL